MTHCDRFDGQSKICTKKKKKTVKELKRKGVLVKDKKQGLTIFHVKRKIELEVNTRKINNNR